MDKSDSKRRERAKFLRNHHNGVRAKLIEQNRKMAEKAIDLINDLYDLRYFNPETDETTHIINCSLWINPWLFGEKRVNKEGKEVDAGRHWSRFPSKHHWFLMRQFLQDYNIDPVKHFEQMQGNKIDGLVRHLAATDPYFALGYSKTGCFQSPSFQFEVDFESNINESTHLGYLNNEIMREIASVLTPHVILSGNRSLYIAFFNRTNLKRETWETLYDTIRRHLIHSGKNDIHTFFGSGLRLPLSVHQKSGGLCRFVGCNSLADNIDYLENIVKDDVSDEDVLELCEKLKVYRDLRFVDDHPQSLTIRERRKIERLSSLTQKSSLSDYHQHIHLLDQDEEYGDIYDQISNIQYAVENEGDEDTYTDEDKYLLHSSLPDLHHTYSLINSGTKSDTNKEYTSVYCTNSERKDEYEVLIQNGIPYGYSTYYLVHTDFVLFTLNKYAERDEALRTLEDTITKGMDDNTTISDRQTKLKSMIELIEKTIKVLRVPLLSGGSFKEDFKSIKLDDEYKVVFSRYRRLVKKEHKSFDSRLYIKALEYILKKLSYFGGESVGIGTTEIAEHFGFTKEDRKKAARILDYFSSRYTCLMMTADYQFNEAPGADGNRVRRYNFFPEGCQKIKSKQEVAEMRKKGDEWLRGNTDKSLEDEIHAII